ncbi:MAG: type II toxin-antitoxin system VapC family toxin [Saprospiraceae bacterium]
MKKICLDTNIFRALSGNDSDVVSIVLNASKISISFVVFPELLSSFKNGNKVKENRFRLTQFMRKNGVILLHSSGETTESYSDIFVALRRKGCPIPTNDIWVAAHAIETGLVLITYDRQFENISCLRLWKGAYQ